MDRRPRQMRPLIDDDLQGHLLDCAHMEDKTVRQLVNEAVYDFLVKHGTQATRDTLRLADEKLAEAVQIVAEVDGVSAREWIEAAVRMRMISRDGVRDVMVAYYKAGRSVQELAETYATSCERTLSILRDAGVNIRKVDREVDPGVTTSSQGEPHDQP